MKVLEKPYVFIVLEFNGESPIVHGVYTDKETAQGKKEAVRAGRKSKDGKVIKDGTANYLAVLKKPIEGKTLAYADSIFGKIIVEE